MVAKAIKQRIKSVKNTAQITKAMEVVSAAKMRKSQEFALRARPYALASIELLSNLLSRTPAPPLLLTERPVKKSLLLMVTSDKGLAGALNANIVRRGAAWVETKEKKKAFYELVFVGKKAQEYFERRGKRIARSFIRFGDYTMPEETMSVADYLIKGFLSGEFDEVEAVYTNFRTTLLQEVVVKKILPATKEGLEEAMRGILPEKGKFSRYGVFDSDLRVLSPYHYEYQFEPSPAEILIALLPQLIRVHVHHIILESNASEHSARMVAMKNASDNASDLIAQLTLRHNKSRQAEITQELAEITAGAEALE